MGKLVGVPELAHPADPGWETGQQLRQEQGSYRLLLHIML